MLWKYDTIQDSEGLITPLPRIHDLPQSKPVVLYLFYAHYIQLMYHRLSLLVNDNQPYQALYEILSSIKFYHHHRYTETPRKPENS